MGTIAVMNPKGGVGKTTTSINLAGGLVERGKRVLLIDLDDQFYASRWAGFDDPPDALIDAMLDPKGSPLTPTASPLGFDVIPASKGLSQIESDIQKSPRLRTRGFQLLRMALKDVQNDYDHVILDCPGDTDFVTLNALLAADAVIVAMKTAHLSLVSLGETWDEVEELMESNDREPRMRILFGMHQRGKRLHREVVELVESEWQDEVFETRIPLNVRIEECSSHGRTIFQHDKAGVGTQAFRDLTEEVLQWLG